MFHIVLYEPEIPPNTGNIIRLCANSGAHLHIIQPAAFSLDDKKLRRAGLDYREFANISEHQSFAEFQSSVNPNRIFGLSTKGTKFYSEILFEAGDALLFGPETRGLPNEILHILPVDRVLRIPMLKNSRSLNLSNTAALVLYEAWRQQGFTGAI
ncbi:MAG: tRNA (uridine(34)/cytosine(34)/5-carboxymethylaminomethyluridine(34)-2'-O)-methyltransferase TrmL [Gammaproteobacteria bacterium]|nr:tRNA (uridine(34)/cytosine(34)/5-carboxymethylaminomethyluridine(34)-2'-O)-methyltransferase TrmL [Gammaproteobacteria bacterium]